MTIAGDDPASKGAKRSEVFADAGVSGKAISGQRGGAKAGH